VPAVRPSGAGTGVPAAEGWGADSRKADHRGRHL